MTWPNEKYRHSLSAKRVKTKQKSSTKMKPKSYTDIIKNAMAEYNIPPKYYSFLKEAVEADYEDSSLSEVTECDVAEIWGASKTREMETEQSEMEEEE